MKKIISLIMIVVFCFLTCVGLSAAGAEGNVITVNNVDVEFSADSNLDNVQKQLIAEYLVLGNKDDQANTYGLVCTLFGHKYETNNVTTTTHRAKSLAPRCLVEEWSLEICSRCEDLVETLVTSYYIYCCE